jgi:poly(3-hydroxyalkanoate) synthetase
MFGAFPMWTVSNYITGQYFRFLEGTLAVTNEVTDIYGQVLEEFFTAPLSLTKRNLNYLQEIAAPPLPAWQTPYKEVELAAPHTSLIKLLDFTQPDTGAEQVIPTLLLPPQAGHHSYIADYSLEQSQTQTLRRNGLPAIYCIEWLGATKATSHCTIEHYIEAVRYSIEKIGGKANLVGDCQGGWLATIFTALYPEMVNSLVVAGAPIDFQAGDSQIKESVNFIASVFPDGGMWFYRKLVELGGGVLDGNFLISGFNLMKPEQLPVRYLNLYRDMHEPQAVKRFQEMRNWYDYPQDIAGAFYLWLVEHLFRDNELIKGKLVVGGKKVDLKRINCPLFLLAGKRDHITPPVQVLNMAQYVSTSPHLIHRYVVDAGHIGLFMGRDVLAHNWSEIAQQISQFSQHKPKVQAA